MIGKAAYNGRFGAMAAVPRGQFCGNLNVIIPQQVQWKPPSPSRWDVIHPINLLFEPILFIGRNIFFAIL